MTKTSANIDPAEQQKFDSIAASWWDPDGESRPLHDLNPARLAYIAERVGLKDANIVDVGCGGGILSESMAASGAKVTGIDVAAKALSVPGCICMNPVWRLITKSPRQKHGQKKILTALKLLPVWKCWSMCRTRHRL